MCHRHHLPAPELFLLPSWKLGPGKPSPPPFPQALAPTSPLAVSGIRLLFVFLCPAYVTQQEALGSRVGVGSPGAGLAVRFWSWSVSMGCSSLRATANRHEQGHEHRLESRARCFGVRTHRRNPGSRGDFIFSFLRNRHSVSTVAAPGHIPTTRAGAAEFGAVCGWSCFRAPRGEEGRRWLRPATPRLSPRR